MVSKGGPQSSAGTKEEEKKNSSPTKPNNGQNSTAHSADLCTPSNSKKQKPSQEAGGVKKLVYSASDGLRHTNPRRSGKVSTAALNNKELEPSLSDSLRKSSVCITKSKTSPVSNAQTTSEKIANRYGNKPNLATNENRDVSQKLKIPGNSHRVSKKQEATVSGNKETSLTPSNQEGQKSTVDQAPDIVTDQAPSSLIKRPQKPTKSHKQT